jgi:hypothetical protein
MGQSYSAQLKSRKPVLGKGNGLRLSQGEINYLRIFFLKSNLKEPWLILSDLLTLAFLPFSVGLVVSVIYTERKRFRKQQRVHKEKEQQCVRYWDI